MSGLFVTPEPEARPNDSPSNSNSGKNGSESTEAPYIGETPITYAHPKPKLDPTGFYMDGKLCIFLQNQYKS
jgi:hypothetical protein